MTLTYVGVFFIGGIILSYVEKQTITRKTSRPVRERTPEEMNTCDHVYKEIDTEITKFYGDNKVAYTIVEGIFFCEKCLDIVKKRKSFEGDDD